MLNPFYSVIAGFVVGGIYSALFLSSLSLRSSGSVKSDFMHGLTFIARFIFIIVAAIVLTIYIKISLFWFLLSLGVTFWVCVLARLRIKK